MAAALVAVVVVLCGAQRAEAQQFTTPAIVHDVFDVDQIVPTVPEPVVAPVAVTIADQAVRSDPASGDANPATVVDIAVTAPAPQTFVAPSRRPCASRRRFTIRLLASRRDPIVAVTVSINGRRVKVLRGRRASAPVDLKGLPRGRYTVTVVATTTSGRKRTGVRRYLTCAPKPA